MKYLASSIILTTTLIAGCSSSSDSNNSESDNGGGTTGGGGETVGGSTIDNIGALTGNILQFGTIDIEEFSSDSTVEVTGGFFQLSAPVTAAEFVSAMEDATQEECTVEVTNLSDLGDIDTEFEFEIDLPGNDITTISAGDVITLSGPSGSYGELGKVEQFGFIGYTTSTDLTFPAPDPLTISIPGDTFPAVSNVQIPAPVAVTGSNTSAGDSVDATLALSWDAVTPSGSELILEASTFSTTTTDFVDVECVLTEDGSFSFPAETITELDNELGAGWSLELDLLSRSTQVFLQSGSSVLAIFRESD